MTTPIRRRPLPRTTRRGSLGVASMACLLAGLACSNPAETLGPDNHVKVTNLVGYFQLTTDNMQNVTNTLSFDWQNPGRFALIDHESFTPHGTSLLIITDAAGKKVYDGKLLYRLEDQTLLGTPGKWTVVFSLDQSVGQIDVTLEAADIPN